MAMFGDETSGIAVCLLDYSASFKRALMYPDWFSLIHCESLSELQTCMSRESLSPVAQGNVMRSISEVTDFMNTVCRDYPEQVMWKGWMMWNLTEKFMKHPVYKELKIHELSENMANGTADKMNLTAHQVGNMLNAILGNISDPSIHSKCQLIL